MRVTLPDGSTRDFEKSMTVAEIALAIGPGLAKAAIAGKTDGRLVDTSTVIDGDVNLHIITSKDKEGLEILRHSCAHLLAQAVKALFPTAQVTIGPVIEDGFYYDFAFHRAFTPEDMIAIESKMKEIAKENLCVTRNELSRIEAIQIFSKMGEAYKVEIIKDIPEKDSLSFYKQGDFIDLCRGPHVPNLGFLKSFKLTKISGAYWRGDAKNAMLSRIYGTAWGDDKALKDYLHRLEEAGKRDHRKLAKQLNLFHIQPEAPGMIFWHPKGWAIIQIIKKYMRSLLQENGYLEVNAPLIIERSLWEKSGHWDKFASEMFTTHSENHDFAIKPMNCPGHIQIFNQGLRSYRDLPLRLAEFGSCHRNEHSGTLHGLMRVRGFVQDDAHIFCTEEQIQAEVSRFIDLLFKVYADFGFNHIKIKLSTRPVQRVGSDEIWDKAEAALELALNNKGLAWELHPGEGAFYGPKIEFSLQDCLDRVWQCGTMQVDFSMPDRLEAVYVAADGTRQTPVMLHRAILGSLERFLGILIEQYAGALPLWLAPEQAVVMSITDKQGDYALQITQKLQKSGIRAYSDLRNEKIGFKIREHTLQYVPYLITVGDREVATETVSVRKQDGTDLGNLALQALISRLTDEVAERSVVVKKTEV